MVPSLSKPYKLVSTKESFESSKLLSVQFFCPRPVPHTGDGTQGLTPARQVLYQSHGPSPALSSSYAPSTGHSARHIAGTLEMVCGPTERKERGRERDFITST
jgi:hypothetical protein